MIKKIYTPKQSFLSEIESKYRTGELSIHEVILDLFNIIDNMEIEIEYLKREVRELENNTNY